MTTMRNTISRWMQKHRRVLLASIVVLALGLMSIRESVVAVNLIDDIKEVRNNNKAAIIDITNIVTKYITVGAKQDWVESYLTKLGFQLNYFPTKDRSSKVLIASQMEKQIIPIGFNDEYRIGVEFVNGNAISVSGQIIFQAL